MQLEETEQILSKSKHIDKKKAISNMAVSIEEAKEFVDWEKDIYVNRLKRTGIVTTEKFVIGYTITKAPQIGSWVVDSFIEKRRQDRYITKAPRFGRGPVALLF